MEISTGRNTGTCDFETNFVQEEKERDMQHVVVRPQVATHEPRAKANLTHSFFCTFISAKAYGLLGFPVMRPRPVGFP